MNDPIRTLNTTEVLHVYILLHYMYCNLSHSLDFIQNFSNREQKIFKKKIHHIQKALTEQDVVQLHDLLMCFWTTTEVILCVCVCVQFSPCSHRCP